LVPPSSKIAPLRSLLTRLLIFLFCLPNSCFFCTVDKTCRSRPPGFPIFPPVVDVLLNTSCRSRSGIFFKFDLFFPFSVSARTILFVIGPAGMDNFFCRLRPLFFFSFSSQLVHFSFRQTFPSVDLGLFVVRSFFVRGFFLSPSLLIFMLFFFLPS